MKILRGALFAVASLWLTATAAFAQSGCSYIAYGAVLTAAQWQSCFQAKIDVVGGGGYLPLAGGTMTGRLITAASITAEAGLNLPAGAAPSAPVNGDIWTTTAGLYVRINGSTVGPLATGTGSVTSVSVTTANGVSGSVATATTTPAITLTLGAITPTTVNGLTISTTTGTLTVTNGKTLSISNTLTFAGTDGTTFTFPNTTGTVATLALAQTFTATKTFTAATSSIDVGANSGNVGIIRLFGNTSGSVTLRVAAAAGTATVFQLPATNGSSGDCLQSNGSGVTSWTTCTGVPGGSTTQVQYNNAGAFGGISGVTTNGTAVTFANGALIVAGSSSGTTIVNATAAASGTLTLPAATDTLVGKATTDTFTNKTYDTAGTGNSFSINSVAVTANTGTGAVARATSPTFVTPVLGAATATSINGLTLTSSTGVLTITNGKTFAVSNTITLDGTDSTVFTFPNATGTVATLAATQAFTNKTLTASSNVLGGVTLTLGSDANGDTYYRASSVLTRLPIGTAGQCLKTNAGATAPEWGTCAAAAAALEIAVTTITGATDTRILFNNAGLLGQYAISGTGNVAMTTSPTFVTPALGAATATSINGATITSTTGGTLTLANSSTLATSGANSITLTSSGATNVTLPTTGTLATLAGSEAFTNKTLTNSNNTLGSVTMDVTGTDADGDTYYRASNVLTRLGIGTNGQCLKTNAGATAPEWGSCASAAADLTIGTTVINSGTNTRILYNNSGILGEYTLTGTGTVVVMATSPTLVTPVLGVATATTINKVALTAPATGSTLTIADGKTLTASASLTLAGTDAKTLTVSNSGTLGGGDAFVLAIAAAKTLTVSNTLTFAGTDATTFTFPNTTGTVATLGLAQTFTATKTFTAATSSIDLGANSGNVGIARLFGNTSGSVTLRVAAAAGSTTFQLPASNGTASYGLQTDGSGITSWAMPGKFVTVTTTADSGSPTPSADTDTQYQITALAQAATFGAPSGTPVNGQKLVIRIKDNGTARALSWNASYRASSDLALPTTTVISKTMYLGFIYNSADSKWDFVAYLNNF